MFFLFSSEQQLAGKRRQYGKVLKNYEGPAGAKQAKGHMTFCKRRKLEETGLPLQGRSGTIPSEQDYRLYGGYPHNTKCKTCRRKSPVLGNSCRHPLVAVCQTVCELICNRCCEHFEEEICTPPF